MVSVQGIGRSDLVAFHKGMRFLVSVQGIGRSDLVAFHKGMRFPEAGMFCV